VITCLRWKADCCSKSGNTAGRRLLGQSLSSLSRAASKKMEGTSSIRKEPNESREHDRTERKNGIGDNNNNTTRKIREKLFIRFMLGKISTLELGGHKI
jgi:hypothetical protein